MLVAVAHWASTKLHYSRDTINWHIPLAFIFILWMEQIFQDREGKMITLKDREMIDNGEYDRQMSIRRE